MHFGYNFDAATRYDSRMGSLRQAALVSEERCVYVRGELYDEHQEKYHNVSRIGDRDRGMSGPG